MDEFFDYAVRGAKSKYRRKPFVPGMPYHVFNRRSDGGPVFLDDEDRLAFVEIAQRLLDPERYRDEHGRALRPTKGKLTLYGYALMTSHYHLPMRQEQADGMTDFMRRLQTAYTKRFNRRHGRTGPMFDERYQAVPIESGRQLKTAIAYIHANPGADAPTYPWSAHGLYLDEFAAKREDAWLDVKAGIDVYGNLANYLAWFNRAVEARKRRDGR